MIGVILLTTLTTFIITTFFGYCVHLALHRPFMGKLYRSHLTHHQKLYPEHQFLSDEYLDAGKDNTVISFLLLGAPLIILPIVLLATHIISFVVFMTAMIGLGVFGGLHNYFHDQFHLRHSWLRRFEWFDRMTDLHYQHHISVHKNFGIYWFGWDKVFGSFEKR